MPIIDLPTDGEQPWGAKLRTAISIVNTQVDTLTADVTPLDGRLDILEPKVASLEAIVPVRSYQIVNTGGVIASTAFVAIPVSPCSITITVPAGGRLARVTYDFQGICNAGTMDVGIAVSGTTTVAADQAFNGTTHVTATGAYATVFNTAANSYRVEKLVSLNAGSNTVAAVARLGGAGGTKQVAAQILTVELV